ncbi:MAG: DUF1566 domain-containing protein [Gammaproteobacteria bacterium]|nr:DUF1566 domain-containing protein [Gammaproteobacteria bacterium]
MMRSFHNLFFHALTGLFFLLLLAGHPPALAAGPFTDNGNGTVTDAATGLIWQQTEDEILQSWAGAGAYCTDLSLGGYSDWRLPEAGELSTLADHDLVNPAIDTIAFPGARSSYYWSGSTDISSPSYAWYVYFYYGNVYRDNKGIARYVRCVRGGSGSFDPLSHLIINGAETVTDTLDDLVWQREDDGVTRTWEDAAVYCENLVLDGKSDWRLPLIDELKRLIDYGQYGPSTNTSIFSGMRSSYYWSGSTYIYLPSYAWYVYFYNGNVDAGNKDVTRYVRCVRGEPGSFDPLNNLIISATPTGGTVPLTVTFTSNFSDGLAPYTYAWQFGDGAGATDETPAHTFNAAGAYTSTLSVTDATGDSLSQSVTITVTAPAHTLAANVTPAGSGSVSRTPDKSVYAVGYTVTLGATPAACHVFDAWSGDCTGGNPSCTLTMDGDKSVSASFSKPRYALSVTALHGTVTRSPDAADYECGASVTLTALPESGYRFLGWQGAGIADPASAAVSVTLNAARQVTALFELQAYPPPALTLSPPGGGSLALSPDRTQYSHGESVTLSATPAACHVFNAWSGDCAGGNPVCDLTMDAEKSVTATFSKPRYALSVTAEYGMVTRSPDAADYECGTPVTLTAQPETGYRFLNWQGEGISDPANPTVTVTLNAARQVTARFELENHAPTARAAVTPTQGPPPLTVILDAGASTDPENNIAGYLWLVNGETLFGMKSSITLTASDIYPVQLTVTDRDGLSDADQTNVTVNHPPRAAFRVIPDPAEASRPAAFDASGSMDPDGAISGYRWSVAGNALAGENITFTFDAPGDYSVELTVTDDLGAENALSRTLSVLPAETVPGRALLIAGGGAKKSNALFAYSNDFVQRMYRLLLQRGFSDENIVYMNPYAPDIDLDGYQDQERLDFDLFDPEADLNAAFAGAAETLHAGQQFILYVHGHARPGHLDILPPYELSVPRLRQLLDSLPSGTEQMVILDTCYSGSFIAGLAAPGRIVISSADDSSLAWNAEYLSFSDKFINALRRGNTLGDAFAFAGQTLRNADRFAGQTPWLDDDGDGVPNSSQDGKMADGLYPGRDAPTGSNPPEITQVHPLLTLDGTSAAATLWVAGPAADAIRTVRAILLSPNVRAGEYQGRETAFGRLETELVYNSAQDRYESEYARFCSSGEWEIWYQAQDNTGAWSEMKSGHLVQAPDISDPVCNTGVSVKVLLNRARYTGGDVFRMELETDGAGETIPFVGIVLPDGSFITYRYNGGFGFINAPAPFRPLLPVNGKRVWPVMEFTLPEGAAGGNYQACGVLMRADAENVLDAANWLDWDCAKMELY